MKFACIFCGHVRSWILCRKSIMTHVVEPTGAAVGAATYHTRGYNVHDGREWEHPASGDLHDFSERTKCTTLDVSEEMRGHVDWAAGCQQANSWAHRQDRLKVPHLRLPGVQTATSLPGAVGMFDCWKRGVGVLHDLEVVHGRFDCVIRMRFDLHMNSPLDWNRIRDEVRKGNMVSPDFCNFNSGGGCNDQFFAAPRDAWIRAMSISDSLQKYCCEDGVELHPETIFGHHLRSCGIQVVQLPMDFVLRRIGGGTHDLRRAKG